MKAKAKKRCQESRGEEAGSQEEEEVTLPREINKTAVMSELVVAVYSERSSNLVPYRVRIVDQEPRRQGLQSQCHRGKCGTNDLFSGHTTSLEGVCDKGCVIRLNDSEKDEYELKGSEAVSIEDGSLYYDGPPASAVPKVGDADQPSSPAPSRGR